MLVPSPKDLKNPYFAIKSQTLREAILNLKKRSECSSENFVFSKKYPGLTAVYPFHFLHPSAEGEIVAFERMRGEVTRVQAAATQACLDFGLRPRWSRKPR